MNLLETSRQDLKELSGWQCERDTLLKISHRIENYIIDFQTNASHTILYFKVLYTDRDITYILLLLAYTL